MNNSDNVLSFSYATCFCLSCSWTINFISASICLYFVIALAVSLSFCRFTLSTLSINTLISSVLVASPCRNSSLSTRISASIASLAVIVYESSDCRYLITVISLSTNSSTSSFSFTWPLSLSTSSYACSQSSL
jgi:hypothetical protein